MTPPELRITDAEIAEVRRGPICHRCNGCGGYLGACLGFICCEDCGGDGYWTLHGDLPPGASARLGRMLGEALRWTPTRSRWDGSPW